MLRVDEMAPDVLKELKGLGQHAKFVFADFQVHFKESAELVLRGGNFNDQTFTLGLSDRAVRGVLHPAPQIVELGLQIEAMPFRLFYDSES